MASTIRGLDKLNRKLRALPKAAEAAIKTAMAQGADEIVALAKSLVPVDTGELRKSIGWTWGDAPKGTMNIASVGDAEGKLRITIYAGSDDAFYARWVEFGTKRHSVAKGGGTKRGQRALARGGGIAHPGATAKPFFYVSYRALRKRTKSRITRAINKSAKQVAAGGGGGSSS
jgi:HK97 gp10 family phage protein